MNSIEKGIIGGLVALGAAVATRGLAAREIGILAARGGIKGFGKGLAEGEALVSSSGNTPITSG